MATAKKLPSGSWRALAYVGVGEDGKRRYKSFTAPTKKEAELLAAQYVADQDRRETSGLTVGEALQQYISAKEGVLSPSTVLGYKRLLRNCYDGVADQYVSRVTVVQLQQWVSSFAEVHSPKYTYNAWGLLCSALDMCGVDYKNKIRLPQRNKRKIDIPGESEIRLLYAAVAGSRLELPFLLATQCGLRASEIAGLRKQDVGAGMIRITQARVTGEHGATVKAPKSWAGYRELPCDDYICRLAALSADATYVTTMDANTISGAWASLVRRTEGLPAYRFHALRHYFASRAALIGVPKEYLAELMGHSSSKMLDEVYLHTFPKAKQAFAEMLKSQAATLLRDADATRNAT